MRTASYHEIVAACPGAAAEFIGRQLSRHATVEQARKAWMAEQNARLAAADGKLAAARASGRQGHSMSVTPEAGAEEFCELVAEKIDRGMTRQTAVAVVATSRPDLHQAYLLATNPGRQQQRLIREKFDLATG